MKVIDCHAHPPRKGYPDIDPRPYIFPQSDEDRDVLLEREARELLADMDNYQVDQKIMLAFPPDMEHEFHYGEFNAKTGVTSYTSHQWISRLVKRYPGRFAGFACLNPLEPGAPAQLERLVKEDGFCGVKIHQAHYNFPVNDQRAFPFYRKCAELGIPAAFHTGFSLGRTIDRLIPTMPLLLDELAYEIPELTIIMCHAGGTWYQEGVLVALRNENIVIDLSSVPWMCRYMVYPEIDPAGVLKRLVEMVGPDRLMFGTDNADEEMNLEYMKALGLDKAALEKIMGGTAARLLKI